MSNPHSRDSTRGIASRLSIGEVAVRRGPNGHRVYGEEDIEWLEICTNLRASGMPLVGIRRYAELVRQGPGNEQERLDLLREHRERVTAQIGELSKRSEEHTSELQSRVDLVCRL